MAPTDHDLDAVTRLDGVRARVNEAAKAGERAPDAVTLVAVSKTFDAHAIRPVLEAGQRVFGENRVQESAGKWPQLRAAFPDVELHLIGPLQSNKARQAVDLFDVVQTLDRPKIVRALGEAAAAAGKSLKVFAQVNTGDEAQKAGCALDGLADLLTLVGEQPALHLQGLMCIPPVDDEPSLHFALLSELAREHGLSGLSMGMSGDFETAIRLGATHVRVGSAIFGARSASQA